MQGEISGGSDGVYWDDLCLWRNSSSPYEWRHFAQEGAFQTVSNSSVSIPISLVGKPSWYCVTFRNNQNTGYFSVYAANGSLLEINTQNSGNFTGYYQVRYQPGVSGL